MSLNDPNSQCLLGYVKAAARQTAYTDLCEIITNWTFEFEDRRGVSHIETTGKFHQQKQPKSQSDGAGGGEHSEIIVTGEESVVLSKI